MNIRRLFQIYIVVLTFVLPYQLTAEQIIELVVSTNNDELKNLTPEIKLSIINKSNTVVRIPQFGNGQFKYMFVVSETGEISNEHRKPMTSFPGEYLPRKCISVLPSDFHSFFLIPLKKSAPFLHPGTSFVVFAIRKPVGKKGVIVSSPYKVVVGKNRNIVSISGIEMREISPPLRKVLFSEMEFCFKNEFLEIERSDLSQFEVKE